MSFLTKLLDKKTSDTTTEGYDQNEIQKLLNGITNIDTFRYYYYLPDSKYPAKTEKTKNQPITETLPFLNQHFTDSLNLHTEIQHKTYKSGKHEVILKGRNPKNEIVKLAIINFQTHQPKQR